MARVKFYLDCRVKHTSGKYPLKLNISHKGRTALLPLNIFLSSDQWDVRAEKIISHPSRAALNSVIVRRKADAETVIASLDADGRLPNMTANEIKKAISADNISEAAPERRDVQSVFEEMISLKKKSTAGIYSNTLTRLKEFCPRLDTLHFEDISPKWIMDFADFVSKYAPSANGRAGHLRVLRTVVNYAIDNEITSHYPFKRIKIKLEPTKKRALSVEQLRLFMTTRLTPDQEKSRDLFILIFLLRGINIGDLLRLRSLVGDRVEYKRAKTGRPYSVKVEPEAYEIIQRLKGKNYLLYPLDECKGYRYFADRLNSSLETISKSLPNFPMITTYWARHTWATIASSLDIPKETIAAGLGHSSNTVTDVYIDFDMRKVDDANRRIIDWVFYGKK